MSNFDPDAYLANKPFDPDAYLAKEGSFDPDQYLKRTSKKADWTTAAKQAWANAGNSADTAGSMIAGGLSSLVGATDTADSIFSGMDKRVTQRNQWANPDQEEIGFGGKLLNVPLGIVTSGLSPAETGKTLIQAGETTPTALKGAAVDAAGNAVGMILPGFKQGGVITRFGTGAAANATQDVLTKLAIQSMAETEKGKAAFQPTLEDAGVAGFTGGTAAAIAGRNKPSPKGKPRNMEDVLGKPAPKADIETKNVPETNPALGKDKSLAAYEQALREQELQRQSAFNRPEQLGNMEAESPMARMARDLGAEPGQLDQPLSRMAEDLTTQPMRSAEMDALDAKERSLAEAQDAVQLRQKALEDAVARQATLDNNASLRQRQEAASAVSELHARYTEQLRMLEEAKANAAEARRLAEESSKAAQRQQMEIDDTQHVLPDTGEVIAPQYGAMQGAGRIDENGMPIKADLSMEAQNLENPLQRNLWGDELPQKSEQENDLGITQAIDILPNDVQARVNGKLATGTPQSQAVKRLTGNPLPLGSRRRKQGGVIHEDLLGIGKAVDFIKGVLRSVENQPVKTILAKYKGTFNEKALKNAYNESLDPKAKEHLVLMRPEVFHSLADERPGHLTDKNSMRKREGVKEGLATEAGLDDVPYLWIDEDGKVIGHEGRHRMDIFAQKGLDVVPVRLYHPAWRNGEGTSPPMLTPQHNNSIIKRPAVPTPKPMMDAGKGERWVNGSKLFPLEIRNNGNEYTAHQDGKQVGRLVSNITPEQGKQIGERASVDIVKVDPDVKGKGVGSALYQAWHDAHEGNITPSGKTSLDAWRLWKKNYEDKVVEFVQQEAQRIRDGASRELVLGNITDPEVRNRVATAANNPRPFNLKPGVSQTFINSQKGQSGKVLVDSTNRLENALEASEDGTLIPKDPEIGTALEKARTEQDGKFMALLQSGSTSTAMKTGSTLIKTASRIVQNAVKRADLKIRDTVFPAETALKSLSRAEINELGQVFKLEMFNKQRFDADTLTSSLTVKQLDAYSRMRDLFDKSLDAQNEARLAKGLDPITPQEAYMSSRWEGAFRRPVYNSEGKLVWYLAADSKMGLEAQTKALLKEQPDLVVDKTKDHKATSQFGKTDLESMYTKMLDILGRDDPAVKKIQEAIENATIAEASTTRNQEKHFQSKANIRGFVGDRPGQMGTKEMLAMFQQQLQYAKNAYTWAEMQTAADGIKQLISDPDIQLTQPNNVKYVREYFKNAIGHGEAKWSKALNDDLMNAGLSPRVVSEAIGDVKSFFILQKLAMSAGFTAANVIQTSNVLPYLMDLKGQGYKGNPVKALAIGFSAGPMMMMSHYLKSVGGEYIDKLPNQFLKDAIRYAEDNGVTARSIYDESPIGTSFNPVANVANIASKTMTVPETFVRSVAFMSYAQMLKDSGKFKDMSALFQKAEELVNKSMVDYRETEKPLMFPKAGLAGNVLNTLQTYPVSFYNQYSYMARQAAEGNPAGLVTMMAMQGLLAGAAGLPYTEDLYKLFMFVKDNLAPTETWADMNDSKFLSDPKLWLLENAGNSAVYGTLSEKLNLGLSSRISAPTGAGMLQSPIGPVTDVTKQVINLGKAVADPTNATKWGQSAMSSMPVGLQGLLETSDIMDGITYQTKPDGTRVYMKTSDLAAREGSVTRTPEESLIRRFGLRSQREVVEKDVTYMTNNANRVARERSKEIVDKFYDAARKGDVEKAQRMAKIYVRLTGKEITDEQMDRQAMNEYLTGLQKTQTRATATPQELINLGRMQRILEDAKR